MSKTSEHRPVGVSLFRTYNSVIGFRNNFNKLKYTNFDLLLYDFIMHPST